jgi:hypothetical protein
VIFISGLLLQEVNRMAIKEKAVSISFFMIKGFVSIISVVA